MAENDLLLVRKIKECFIEAKGGMMIGVYLDSIERTRGIKIENCVTRLDECKCEAYGKALITLLHPSWSTSVSLILIEDMIEKYSTEEKWKLITLRQFVEKAKSYLDLKPVQG